MSSGIQEEDVVRAKYRPAKGNRPRHLTISIPSAILNDLAQANRQSVTSSSSNVEPLALLAGPSSSSGRINSSDARARHGGDERLASSSSRRPSIRRAAQSLSYAARPKTDSIAARTQTDALSDTFGAPPAYDLAMVPSESVEIRVETQVRPSLRSRGISAVWRGDGLMELNESSNRNSQNAGGLRENKPQATKGDSQLDKTEEEVIDEVKSKTHSSSSSFSATDIDSPGSETSLADASSSPYDDFEALSSPPIDVHTCTAYRSSTRPRSSSTTLLALQQTAQLPLSYFWHRVALTFLVFGVSSIAVIYIVASVPTLKMPYTMGEVKEQTILLKEYAGQSWNNSIHVAFVLASLMTWKQSFSIPGSAVMNIILGAMYGTVWATLFASLLTAIGSTVSYALARMCSPFVERYMIKAITLIRRAVEANRGNLFSYLLLARLFPLLPYSVLNIAAGVLGLPLAPYMVTLFIGSIPYNFVTCNIGSLLSSLGQISDEGDWHDILGPTFYLQVVGVCLASTLPVLFKDRLSRWIKRLLGGDDLAYRSVSSVLPQYRNLGSHSPHRFWSRTGRYASGPYPVSSAPQHTIITLQAMATPSGDT